MAVKRPSGPAPKAMRCSVRGRPPTGPNICGRSRTSLTGRPAWRAAIAASTTCDHTEPLQPNPPPTNGHTTRSLSGDRPSVLATVRRTPETYCVLSYNVRESPSHTAMVAWGSMGLCVSMGVP